MGRGWRLHTSRMKCITILCLVALVRAEEERIPVLEFPIAFHSDDVLLAAEHTVNLTAGETVNVGVETPIVNIASQAFVPPFARADTTLSGSKCLIEGAMLHNVPTDGALPPEVCFCVLDRTTSMLLNHCAVLSK